MKKLVVFILTVFLLLTNVHSEDSGKVCENRYDTFQWNLFFAWIHCTEDIDLSKVSIAKPELQKVAPIEIAIVLRENNKTFIEYMEAWKNCKDFPAFTEFKVIEDKIYTINGINFSSTSSQVETLTSEVEQLQEDYNDEELYDTAYNEIKSTYTLAADSVVREKTRILYHEKQQTIRRQIFAKQQQKLLLMYKMSETQKLVENFYKYLDKLCYRDYFKYIPKESAVEEEEEVETWTGTTDEETWSWTTTESQETETWTGTTTEEEEVEETDEQKITKYKEELNEKVWERLEKMSRIVLQKVSIKLLGYISKPTTFKKYSGKHKDTILLKLKALKALVDSKIN